jgi:hypothetical protein
VVRYGNFAIKEGSKMNKTITSLALLVVAASAQAIIAPPRQPKPFKSCLSVYEDSKGNVMVGDCDKTELNRRHGLALKENGCAEGQASFDSRVVKIRSCPTWIQL